MKPYKITWLKPGENPIIEVRLAENVQQAIEHSCIFATPYAGYNFNMKAAELKKNALPIVEEL